MFAPTTMHSTRPPNGVVVCVVVAVVVEVDVGVVVCDVVAVVVTVVVDDVVAVVVAVVVGVVRPHTPPFPASRLASSARLLSDATVAQSCGEATLMKPPRVHDTTGIGGVLTTNRVSMVLNSRAKSSQFCCGAVGGAVRCVYGTRPTIPPPDTHSTVIATSRDVLHRDARVARVWAWS